MRTLRFLLVSMFAVILAGATLAVQAQTNDDNNVVWNAQYYNNSYLGGPAVLSRTESRVMSNWGSGSPASTIDNDNFSARYTTSAFFETTTYRFTVLADDGVRVIVDNNVIIDTFTNPQPGETLVADVAMTRGRHNVQVDYREVQGLAYINVGWVPTTNPPSQPQPGDNSPPAPNGDWVAYYYANPSLSGSPVAIQSEISPTHNWGSSSPLASVPADNFSAQWIGTFNLAGTYELSVRADDGVRVFVDGVTYIDEWHSATGDTYTTQFSVESGSHTIVVQYYEAAGIAFLDYSLTGVSVDTPSQPGSNFGWLAQYYNNAALDGAPVVTQTVSTVSRNWGEGSPMSVLPVDRFSVRWTRTEFYEAGTYILRVRVDDGVRVYIDGDRVIDEWHLNNGDNQYVETVYLTAGSHTVQIEYYENLERAFIEYSLDPYFSSPITPPVNTGSSATVTAYRLNVRQEPNVFAPILTKISRDETYPIVGKNADGSWIELNVNGQQGWVNQAFTDEFNLEAVPVTFSNPAIYEPNTEFALTTTVNLNMRVDPSTNSGIIRVIPNSTRVGIVARTADASWWKVNYGGDQGWVSDTYVNLDFNVNINEVPVSSS